MILNVERMAVRDFSVQIFDFFNRQIHSWDLLAKNYRQLQQIKTRTCPFKGFRFIFQYNPERIKSSSEIGRAHV